MDNREIEQVLLSEGYSSRHETSKVSLFRKGTSNIYLKQAGTDRPLIVHGRYEPRVAEFEQIPGVLRQKPATAAYHNIHMSQFDLRMNRGRTPTRYGYDFGFETAAALRAFLMRL